MPSGHAGVEFQIGMLYEHDWDFENAEEHPAPFPGQKGVGGEVVAHFGSTRSTNLPSSG